MKAYEYIRNLQLVFISLDGNEEELLDEVEDERLKNIMANME